MGSEMCIRDRDGSHSVRSRYGGFGPGDCPGNEALNPESKPRTFAQLGQTASRISHGRQLFFASEDRLRHELQPLNPR